jgi:hypothetical protein
VVECNDQLEAGDGSTGRTWLTERPVVLSVALIAKWREISQLFGVPAKRKAMEKLEQFNIAQVFAQLQNGESLQKSLQ